jgi:hypothetical protein
VIIKVCNNSPSNLYLFQDRKNLDVSCAGQNLIGRKRELTTTGVKPWMHRKHLLGRGKSEINSFDLAMFNLLISC